MHVQHNKIYRVVNTTGGCSHCLTIGEEVMITFGNDRSLLYKFYMRLRRHNYGQYSKINSYQLLACLFLIDYLWCFLGRRGWGWGWERYFRVCDFYLLSYSFDTNMFSFFNYIAFSFSFSFLFHSFIYFIFSFIFFILFIYLFIFYFGGWGELLIMLSFLCDLCSTVFKKMFYLSSVFVVVLSFLLSALTFFFVYFCLFL